MAMLYSGGELSPSKGFSVERSLVWRFIGIVGLLLAVSLAGCGPYVFRSGALLEPPNPAPEIALPDQRGHPFRLSEQQGRIQLIFFGFTNCPDVCPTALAELAAVRKKLGNDAQKIQVVFVSVDPERDTPERLGRYVDSFDTGTIALHGTQDELNRIYQDYGVMAVRRDLPDSALKYTMDHTASVYIIDQKGNWRGMISHGAPIDDIVSDLQYLIRTGGSS